MGEQSCFRNCDLHQDLNSWASGNVNQPSLSTNIQYPIQVSRILVGMYAHTHTRFILITPFIHSVLEDHMMPKADVGTLTSEYTNPLKGKTKV